MYIKGLVRARMSGEAAGPDGLENWVIVAEEEATYAELQEYCKIRRLLPLWAGALRGLVQGEETQEANNNLNILDNVDCVNKLLPAASDLLHGMYAEDTEASIAAAAAQGKPPWLQRPWVWRYNSAYCAFSDTNVFSRSWLLVALAGAMQDLNGVWISLPEAIRNERPRPTLYKLEEFYDVWKQLAERAVNKPSIAWHKLREVYGPRHAGRPKKSGIQHKLDALKRVGEWEGGRTEANYGWGWLTGQDKNDQIAALNVQVAEAAVQLAALRLEVANLKLENAGLKQQLSKDPQVKAVAVPKPAVTPVPQKPVTPVPQKPVEKPVVTPVKVVAAQTSVEQGFKVVPVVHVHGTTVYTGTERREFSNGHTSHTYKIKVYECSGGYEQWADDAFECFMSEATLKQKYPYLPIFDTKTPMSDREREAWGEELRQREDERRRDEAYGYPEQFNR